MTNNDMNKDRNSQGGAGKDIPEQDQGKKEQDRGDLGTQKDTRRETI